MFHLDQDLYPVALFHSLMEKVIRKYSQQHPIPLMKNSYRWPTILHLGAPAIWITTELILKIAIENGYSN